MRLAHDAERVVGIDWYASDVPGTGGRLREQPEDFRVRELETVDPEPVGADPAAFPHLLVRATLRGWDTNDFAGRLSDALGVSRERVGWAGTKDKHAVTTQLFSIRDVDPDDVPEMGDAELTVVGRFGRSLAFGDLAGNAFEIRVQQPERPENAAAVTEALRAGDPDTDSSGGDSPHQAGSSADSVVGDGRAESAATVAVPNYFGHQRFGSQRAVTHEVGLRVVRGDWRGAVLAYCGNPSETEPTPTRAARRFVDEQAASEDPDWRAAAEALPRALGYERAMLSRLAGTENGPDDWRRALEAVPTNLQRLFVNAAQSYAFNRIVSERITAGLPLVEPVEGDVVATVDRDRTHPEAPPAPDADRVQRVASGRVETVRRHCRRGRAFVTAPLVGTETTLAGGEPGTVERSVLDDLGLDPGCFDLPGEFGSTGTRRATGVRTTIRVSEPLSLSFSLPPGSYATTLLREYLKVEPSTL